MVTNTQNNENVSIYFIAHFRPENVHVHKFRPNGSVRNAIK